ncbi:MAG: GNAT family N-acetyltransferase [Anaerolineales bacterium]|nr:GNAT family N-acetyltransferase [Anaerolineales bacterium]
MQEERGTARFRPVLPDDSEAVLRLAEELGYFINPEAGRKRLREITSNKHHLFLVAELNDGTIAGWAHAALQSQFLIDQHVELHGLIVGERWRSRGIGEKLLVQVEAWARMQGCVLVLVRTNVIRERAHTFYTRLGYTEQKRQAILIKELD